MNRGRVAAGYVGAWLGLVFAGATAVPARAQPRAPEATRPRVVMLTPNSEHNTYWPQVFRIVGEVADDLGFDFVPFSLGVDDRFERLDASLRILRSLPRPDAVIASVVIGHSHRLLKEAEALGIPVFIMGPLFAKERARLGGLPGQRFSSWAALLSHAEEKKGYLLGRALLAAAAKARATGADGRIHVVGVGGDPSWFGSELRAEGLKRAVAEDPRAVLEQVVPTKWTVAEGRAITARLLKRYPDARVVWAASDQLGQGAVTALTAIGYAPGRDVFVGGLDLSQVGLSLVRKGDFVATVASTMLAHAETAIYVYDHLQGHSLEKDPGLVIEFQPYVATSDRLDEHARLSACLPAIDFSRLSKAKNPKLKRYDFSLPAYLQAAGDCGEAWVAGDAP